MTSAKKKFQTIDEYRDSFPKNVQSMLERMRSVISKAAPSAEETISYQMPAFWFNGILVYFAAWKDHLGFYPTSKPIEVFKKELKRYEITKGAIHFPLDKPLPARLIQTIVRFKVKENLKRSKQKNQRRLSHAEN
jgi:uncharacterized protein YdhG (YjbR/CyaY superfamily)